MAIVYVTEYIDIDGTRQVPKEPPLVQQTIAIGGSSAASNPFDSRTTVIRVHTDAICSVVVSLATTLGGATPAILATATSGRMAANQTEYRGVSGGQIISVITNT
jgi:hypothetical protein